MSNLANIDLTDPRFKANPYPIYDQLRAQTPVVRISIGFGYKAWLVTRYEDVVFTLKDQRFTKDVYKAPKRGFFRKEMLFAWMFGPFVKHMLNADEPDHTRLRGLVQKAFTARFVESLQPRIESLSEELLDRIAAQGHMDLMRDFALPLPVTVITEMLGVPAADRGRFVGWITTILDTGIGPQSLKMLPLISKFKRYVRELMQLRRRQPENDLISALVVAEEAGDKLSEAELMAMIFLLLIAGYETTVNLIGNGMLALLDHPAELEKLRTQPAIMPSAVEELLRYDGPLEIASQRYALCDIEIAGTMIPRGHMLAPGLTSANRDPRQFEQPNGLNLTREPNRHVGLGQGIHYCLGAPLARLEAQIAFAALLRRLPEIRLAVPRNSIRWRSSLVIRGLQELPIAFRTSAAVRGATKTF
ncbi:MAG TPA: cytochrome P450 [Candidatus Angelobacter sp.]|nr:MAG: cytochrome P450 [Candidatus Angelobacter sp. Gp1-AA117]HMC29378.1 cytochrome P450 [Candidatus Angelobacter sp.]